MSRSVAWRRLISDVCSWRQDEALSATIYILRETGPTGFLLKEDGETKKFKVYLGDPHSCTCAEFKKDKDLCKHICWVLLKKFRIPRTNPVSWQLGLVEREINEILRGIVVRQQPTGNARKIAAQAKAEDEDANSGNVQQREIGEEDVCPICQEVLLEKRLPVTFCKFGCGNNVHINCMKVWAEHQKTQGADTIKCPMCRENFGPISLLQQEFRNSSVRETRAQMLNEHLGTTCKKCYVCPIVGKCYKCIMCADYYLCQACFNTPTHDHHNFSYREKPNQRWREAPRVAGGGSLPQAVVQNLMNRDISDNDYDLLLQLDGQTNQPLSDLKEETKRSFPMERVSQTNQPLSDLTEETVRSFPMERVRASSTLLQPGQQCRVCLRPYQEGQFVRRLLCKHKFHRECIDNWLLHQHPTCPVDGTVFTNDSVRQIRDAARTRQQRQQQEVNGQIHPNNANPTALEIPGIGITSLGNSRVLDRHMNGVLGVSGLNSNGNQDTGNANSNGSGSVTSHGDSNRLSNGVSGVSRDSEFASSLFIANRHLNPGFPSGSTVNSNNRGGGGAGRGERGQAGRGGQINRGRLRSQRVGSGRSQHRSGTGLAVHAQNTGSSENGNSSDANNRRRQRPPPRSDIEYETIALDDNSYGMDISQIRSTQHHNLEQDNSDLDNTSPALYINASRNVNSARHLQPLHGISSSQSENISVPGLSLGSVLNSIENQQSQNGNMSVLGSSNTVLNPIETAIHVGPAQERMGQLSFANLLMSDIQRSISRQSNGSSGGNDSPVNSINNNIEPVIISDGNTYLDSDRNTSDNMISSNDSISINNSSLQQQNRDENETIVNMRIGAIGGGNNAQDAIQRGTGGGTRGRKVSPGVIRSNNPNNKGRAKSLVPEAELGENGSVLSRNGTGDLDVSGRRVNSGGNRGENRSSNVVQQNEAMAERIPVAPSIPLPRDARDISLGNVENNNPKPPSGHSGGAGGGGGGTPNGRSKQARMRSRLINKELNRIRSKSRERAQSAENREGQNTDLYVGHDPSTVAGFNSDFLLTNSAGSTTRPSTNQQPENGHVTSTASNNHNHIRSSRKKSSDHGLSQSEERYRWGATQNLTGSEIMLSGNAL